MIFVPLSNMSLLGNIPSIFSTSGGTRLSNLTTPEFLNIYEGERCANVSQSILVAPSAKDISGGKMTLITLPAGITF